MRFHNQGRGECNSDGPGLVSGRLVATGDLDAHKQSNAETYGFWRAVELMATDAALGCRQAQRCEQHLVALVSLE